MPAVVVTAALAAASGRYLLALAFRLFGDHLPAKMRGNLRAAQQALQRNRRNMILALGLFALSPLPSAQLFEAAGLARVRLPLFTAAFFCGRIVSYSIYALTATGIKQSSLGEAFRASFTSPAGIAIQIAMIGLLVLLVRIDWAKRLGPGPDK